MGEWLLRTPRAAVQERQLDAQSSASHARAGVASSMQAVSWSNSASICVGARVVVLAAVRQCDAGVAGGAQQPEVVGSELSPSMWSISLSGASHSTHRPLSRSTMAWRAAAGR